MLTPQPVRVVPETFVSATAAVQRQHDQPTGLRFGLQIGTFTHPDGREATGRWLREIAVAAEAAGFDAIYVMDHFRQIPQVGRAWDDFLESWTTLAYLAACTERVRLGPMVSGITYRNVAHLGKIAATLDVLSGGRAVCGLGLAWFAAEHKAYGWDFPPVPERYRLLEDALRLLPVLWGPGGKPFEGDVLTVPDTSCYPRPIQAQLPIMVGGGGERRTLRLAARYADLANVFGDADAVAAQDRGAARALPRRRPRPGRGGDDAPVDHPGRRRRQAARRARRRLRPGRQSPAAYATAVNAGTVADQIGRFRELAEAGAAEVTVRLPDLTTPDPLERMSAVIAAFR